MGNEQSANVASENQAENYYLSGVDRFRPQVYKYNMNGSLIERMQVDDDTVQRDAIGANNYLGDDSPAPNGGISRFHPQNSNSNNLNNNNLNTNSDQESESNTNRVNKQQIPQYRSKEEQRKAEQQREASHYVPFDPKKDKDVIEFPRNVLAERQKPHHLSHQDIHSVYQNLQVNPELLQRIDRQINKSENTLEQMEVEERKHTIVEQLGRITYLEDRLECLQKEVGNQIFHLKFKHKKALNFQNDYNKLRDETMAHQARIATIEEQTRMKDMSKIQQEMLNCESDIKQKEKEIEDLNDQANYWKQKAMIDENCIAIITSLKFRSQHLMRENKRLNDILYKDEEYSDIKTVMYGNKQLQMQQQIFEETDNLLKEYYESTKYDNVFEEKKSNNNTSKSYTSYANDKNVAGQSSNTRTIKQTTTTSNANTLSEVSKTLRK